MTGLRSIIWLATVSAACCLAGQDAPAPGVPGKKPDRQDVPAATFGGLRSEIIALAFHADGSQLFAAYAQEACFWNTASGKELRRVATDGESVVAVARDFSRLAISHSFHVEALPARRGKVTLLDVATGKEILNLDAHGEWDANFPFPPAITALAFSPDGRQLATAGSVTKVGGPHGLPGGVIKLWDFPTGRLIRQFGALSTRGEFVVFSPDGKRVAAGTSGASGELPESGEVHVWDAASGERLHHWQAQADVDPGANCCTMLCVAFDPAGKTVAAAVSDGSIHVWDLSTGKERYALRGHVGDATAREVDPFTGLISARGASVRHVAFSPDGSRLASVGYDRAVRLWNSQNGQRVGSLRFNAPRINAVAFSSDGRWLAAGGGEGAKSGEVAVWDVAKLADTLATGPETTAKVETPPNYPRNPAAFQAEETLWQDLDTPRRGLKERIVKIAAKSPAPTDRQLTAAVFLLCTGRAPTDEEASRTQQEFAKADDRGAQALRVARGLAGGKEYRKELTAANDVVLKVKRAVPARPMLGGNGPMLTMEDVQKLAGQGGASVDLVATSDEQAIELIYLLTVSRFPTEAESRQLVARRKNAPDRATATQEIFWILMNQREFLMAKD